MLEIAGLSVRFGGLQALDDVSLRVNDREIVGLVGPNGAGKTTLFNAVSGTVRAQRGTIRFAADDLTTLSPYRRVRLLDGSMKRWREEGREVVALAHPVRRAWEGGGRNSRCKSQG